MRYSHFAFSGAGIAYSCRANFPLNVRRLLAHTSNARKVGKVSANVPTKLIKNMVMLPFGLIACSNLISLLHSCVILPKILLKEVQHFIKCYFQAFLSPNNSKKGKKSYDFIVGEI
jgi:hypothetical protein